MPDLPLGAVIAFGFDAWDVRQEIAILHQVGVRRVQVYRNYARGITPERVCKILGAEGLIPDSLHGYFKLHGFEGPPCDLSGADPAERRAAWEVMRAEAEFVRALGCTDIVVHPVGLGPTRDDRFRPDALEESGQALARIGEEVGVRFLFENMPPRRFGSDVAVLRRIADRVGSPRVGLAFDSGHAALVSDPVQAVRIMGPRLWAVHLHDNLGTDDSHLVPGAGIIDFERVASALSKVGFGGTFMLEIYCPAEEVRRALTPARLAYIEHLRRIASGLKP